MSREPPRNPNAPFDHPDGAGHVRTHLWIHDVADKTMREIVQPPDTRIAGVIRGANRLLCSGNENWVACVFTCDMDGGNREDVWSGPGYAYGTSLSPDGTMAAHHIVGVPGRPNYEIWVMDIASRKRTVVFGADEWLSFGPLWSPDGQWLLYQRCLSRQDPGHDRSDVCISRPDGSEHRVLTEGQSHWFATSFGTPAAHGSGSNMPVWTPDGRIACALLLPGSRSPWPYAAGRPDNDHFNRDYRPGQAQGGTRICIIDPDTGAITPITNDEPPTWNFRLSWSPDGARLAFVRADVGCASELWVMDAGGGNRRRLTRAAGGIIVDHPTWTRLAAADF